MKSKSGAGSRDIWNPPLAALSLTRLSSADDSHPGYIELQHSSNPYQGTVDIDDGPGALWELATTYVRAADQLADLGIPEVWLDALGNSDDPGFGWCPFWDRDAPDGDERARGGSFRAERKVDGEVIDSTVVLIASQRFDEVFINSGFGVRVVMHAYPAEEGKEAIRITGLSASLPFGPYVPKDFEAEALEARGQVIDILNASKKPVSSRLALDETTLVYNGIRIGRANDSTLVVEVRGGGREVLADNELGLPYGFAAAGSFDREEKTLVLNPVNRHLMLADAKALVFPGDPASQGPWVTHRKRGPRRSEKGLANLRTKSGPLTNAAFPLEDNGELIVHLSRFVRKDLPLPILPNKRLRTVNTNNPRPRVRSDDASALGGYWSFHQMLALMKSFDLDLNAYFRNSSLPLHVFYRSGIRPGPGKDGQTINARVLPEGWPVDFYGPATGTKPALEIHVGIADRSTRARGKWLGASPVQAEPLGLANDARWMWHEFGHVLLMASVGELEFRFAHSAGDALAAIATDPSSKLTEDRSRGATFPWVFLPRRHDRCVSHGWSWCGSMHRPLDFAAKSDWVRRKGYRTEQILSSSLFRLYLSLGGDTVDNAGQPDLPTRTSASRYALYLIIKAIGLLGGGGKVPTALGEGFVNALIDADSGTNEFDGTGRRRVGGCARKASRWAFEAQGMYAADPAAICNKPGRPEIVDIYIEDRRGRLEENPAGPIRHGPGGYIPVSLDDHSVPASWHAHAGAIKVVGNAASVVVKNRGRQTAPAVMVRVWWAVWNTGAPLPEWNAGGGAWTECVPTTPPSPVPANATGVEFGPFAGVPTAVGRYVLMAESSCAEDRAISDLAGDLPCSLLATPLVDLVAGDNNIGLTVVKIP